MARRVDKEKAIILRKKGMSYSQIKTELGLSKSTLSGWLQGMPLSEERIRELRDFNPIRIERSRNTKLKRRQERLDLVFRKVSKDIGKLSKRDLFIAGLFLYWAEGGKTERYSVSFTNTDPDMVNFFLRWMNKCFGVSNKTLTIRLHLYKDMNKDYFTQFWSKKLKISKNNFKNPYIKNSSLTGLTYKNGFGKGTCNVRINNRDITEYIMAGLKYLKSTG